MGERAYNNWFEVGPHTPINLEKAREKLGGFGKVSHECSDGVVNEGVVVVECDCIVVKIYRTGANYYWFTVGNVAFPHEKSMGAVAKRLATILSSQSRQQRFAL